MLDSLYAQAMRVRRRWFESRPERRRRLARPVISVGNLSVGGTGKTPVVGAIATWLIANGERPSILSRGYARANAVDGVVVVSDGAEELSPFDRAGDEPLMLARQVPGGVVCVSPDRHLAGTLAERRFGCTVHLLDDGFQHVGLARDLDILVTTIGEIPQGRVIPRGRLREPMDAAARAHLLVVNGATAGAAAAEAWALGISQSCGAQRVLQEPVKIGNPEPGLPAEASAKAGIGNREPGVGSRESGVVNREQRVLAVAGIAHPARFADALREAGWRLVETVTFPDHHRYSAADLDTIARTARDAGADAVFTTDKDAVRFEALGTLPFPLYRAPLTLSFDPQTTLFDVVRSALERAQSGAVSFPLPARSQGLTA